MKITKRRIRSILKEITPGAAGIAATGGGTPADQGFAAAQADDASRTALADAWSLLEELEEALEVEPVPDELEPELPLAIVLEPEAGLDEALGLELELELVLALKLVPEVALEELDEAAALVLELVPELDVVLEVALALELDEEASAAWEVTPRSRRLSGKVQLDSSVSGFQKYLAPSSSG